MVSRLIYILNGPNLNLLGEREPEIYGYETLEDVRRRCELASARHDLQIQFHQSNHEGVLIDWVHEARQLAAGIIINPAGLSFKSISLLDALKAFDKPKIEVHLANIHRREKIYHNSLVSLTATGVICGFGAHGYELALEAMANRLNMEASPKGAA